MLNADDPKVQWAGLWSLICTCVSVVTGAFQFLSEEIISSHTARRSAATNMYNSGRMKTLQIMLITGHTTEKNFFRYIKIGREENAKNISTDLFFRK